MTRRRHLLIAAGGTGGHMFPAQALAEAMLNVGWRVSLSTDARGARYTGGFPHSTEIKEVSSASFARGGLIAKAFVPLRIAIGVLAMTRQMRKDRPDVVIGFGGYPSIPALGSATLLRLPRMIHEQNGILGRVNRLFARRVAYVACGVWPTEVPKGANPVHVGNPVRGAVLDKAAAPYVPPSSDNAMSLLIMGGSQGARILSDVVPGAIAALPAHLRKGLSVSHQARAEDHIRVLSQYEKAGITADVQPFFRDVPQRMERAQLVISRAGASSIADLTVIGRPSILIPFAAAAGDHQTANARGLVEAGAAILIPESAFTIDALSAQITTILSASKDAAQMAAAALHKGMPDAASQLMRLVLALGGEGAPDIRQNKTKDAR